MNALWLSLVDAQPVDEERQESIAENASPLVTGNQGDATESHHDLLGVKVIAKRPVSCSGLQEHRDGVPQGIPAIRLQPVPATQNRRERVSHPFLSRHVGQEPVHPFTEPLTRAQLAEQAFRRLGKLSGLVAMNRFDKFLASRKPSIQSSGADTGTLGNGRHGTVGALLREESCGRPEHLVVVRARVGAQLAFARTRSALPVTTRLFGVIGHRVGPISSRRTLLVPCKRRGLHLVCGVPSVSELYNLEILNE
jgi:hypothetical protein